MEASDIRILKSIGTIQGLASGMQLELNIVSIDGGRIQYDLREWSLDHSSIGSGVSFDDEGAKVLLALLKECFKDNGEGIDINSIHIPDTDLFGNPISEPSKPNIDLKVVELLKAEGITFTDKREKGGALWITGGHELDPIMMKMRSEGYKFFYSEKGGKQTKGQPGWYLRAPKQTKILHKCKANKSKRFSEDHEELQNGIRQ